MQGFWSHLAFGALNKDCHMSRATNYWLYEYLYLIALIHLENGGKNPNLKDLGVWDERTQLRTYWSSYIPPAPCEELGLPV